MSSMTVLSYQAQPHRPHLGTRTRAAQGLKDLQGHLVQAPIQDCNPTWLRWPPPCLNMLGDKELGAPRSSQSCRGPQESSHRIPLIAQTEKFLKPEKQLVPRSPS